ncbi:hypothetical protein SAY86_001503 [Trapa natans]|uniref:C2 NT-type domain-containing protein n=1 Tax=Trapa natans TaxID=22666 RepID=A0AAN7RHM6_TRANT|nr:hypothetical protein SAY86_001503 [Trapa natans]
MFKQGRWRGEKNRVKAVFKLQFHATQVSETGAEGLIVALVPADGGKPPVKSEKALVEDGRCQWETPIYQRVMFTRELLTGKINRRIYSLVVSTGLGRSSSVVGEVSVDLADYVEATKASSISIPLKNSTASAVLHVLIQRVEDNSGQSVVEAHEDANIKHGGRNCVSRLSNAEKDDSMRSDFMEDGKSNCYGGASSGSDLTLSTASESSSSGLNTPREVGTRHGNSEQQDPASFLSLLSYASLPQTQAFEANPKSCQDNGRPKWEWTFDGKPGSYDAREMPNSDVKRLRDELAAMARKVDVSEMELQALRRQITKESRRGQELVKEVEGLRMERDSLEEECRAFRARFEGSKSKKIHGEDGGDLQAILEEVRQEVNYEKEMNFNLRLQLQKTQQSNEELILAVTDLDEMLEQKNQEILDMSRKTQQVEKGDAVTDEEEQRVLEELVKEHNGDKNSATEEMKLVRVCRELDTCKKEKDELEMQMEQLALDYEILKQENHEILYRLEQSELQEQLKDHSECSSGFELESPMEVLERDLEEKSKNFSDSLETISELKIHVRNLEEEMEIREREIEANLEAIVKEKIEQEKRAIRAEEILKKMQLRNVSTAQKLQEDFRRLSLQMASMFDENEKATLRVMKEASNLRREKSRMEELLGKANGEIQSVRKTYEQKLAELSCQMKAKEDQIGSLKCEILSLREENGLLTVKVKQSKALAVELGMLKAKLGETEGVVMRGNEERSSMSQKITMLKEEKEEKMNIIQRLEVELETVSSELTNLKGSIGELELKKEKFRNQASQLKSDMQKKEDAIAKGEKKATGGSAGIRSPSPTRNNRSSAAPVGPGNKDIWSLKEKIRSLEGKIETKEVEMRASRKEFLEREKEMLCKIEEFERRMEEQKQVMFHGESAALGKDLEDLKTESEKLKERNELMEVELKDLQQRYSEMSVKFAEVEGERQQLAMDLRSIKNHPKSLSGMTMLRQ